MSCCRCEYLVTNHSIKVIDKKYNNSLKEDEFHFEEGYKCNYNGKEGGSLSDLGKGKCKLVPAHIWEVLSQNTITLQKTRYGIYLDEDKANEKLNELRKEAQTIWDNQYECVNEHYYIRRTEING